MEHLSLHDDEDVIPDHSMESTSIDETSESVEDAGSASENYAHSHRSEQNLDYDALDYEPYEWEKYDDVDG